MSGNGQEPRPSPVNGSLAHHAVRSLGSPQHYAAAGILFLAAFLLRRHLCCGFVLGDDLEDFVMLRDILRRGPDWSDQLHLRFGVWWFFFLSAKVFGVSETAFFLPTWAISSTVPVLAYLIFIARGQSAGRAFLQSSLLVVAPFEVLLGAVHTNDLILSWCIALGLLTVFALNSRSVAQGVILAMLFWFAFYVKLWVVYFLPVLLSFFLVQIRRHHRWSTLAAFSGISVLLHGATLLFWKLALGTFVPFLNTHAATYPVATADLPRTFWQYPAQIFLGSEFGTTLFGLVPYLFVALLLAKLLARFGKKQPPNPPTPFGRFDELDVALLSLAASFFILLNFFPNTFKFDRYYSAPRIFRYLAPLSLLMTLQLAKMLGDLAMTVKARVTVPRRMPWALATVVAVGLPLSVSQARQALSPALTYRQAFLAFLADVRALRPELLITDRALEYWLTQIYLTPQERQQTSVISPQGKYRARDHELWLRERMSQLPKGTLLLSGLGSYVYFGAHSDGFRLKHFSAAIDSNWTPIRNYGPLDFLPRVENATLWELRHPPASAAPEPEASAAKPGQLLAEGMKYFENHDYLTARRYFRRSLESSVQDREDARYFQAVTYYREHRWADAASAFTTIASGSPQNKWTAAAHWHLGMCQLQLGDDSSARTSFERVIRGHPGDKYIVGLARDSLRGMEAEQGWLYAILGRIRDRLAR